MDAAECFPRRGRMSPEIVGSCFKALEDRRRSSVAETNTTGVRRLRGSAFSRRHTSNPWVSGNKSFSRTKSGWRLGQRQAQLPRSVLQSHRTPGPIRVLPNRRNSMDPHPQPRLLRPLSPLLLHTYKETNANEERQWHHEDCMHPQWSPTDDPADSPSGTKDVGGTPIGMHGACQKTMDVFILGTRDILNENDGIMLA